MHSNVVERAEVSISDDVRAIVRDTNHAVLVALFWPIMLMRLREVLEKTLSEQLRAVVNCPRPVSPSLISAASYIFILRDFDRRIHPSLFRVGNVPSLQKIVIRLIVNHTPGQYPSPTKL